MVSVVVVVVQENVLILHDLVSCSANSWHVSTEHCYKPATLIFIPYQYIIVSPFKLYTFKANKPCRRGRLVSRKTRTYNNMIKKIITTWREECSNIFDYIAHYMVHFHSTRFSQGSMSVHIVIMIKHNNMHNLSLVTFKKNTTCKMW